MPAGWDIDLAQQTLKSWADTQSGITFVMANQHHSPPAFPYGTIQVLSGPVSTFADGGEHVYNSGPDNVTYRSRNLGVATIRFQVFSQSQSGSTSARAYLESMSASLGLPSACETLRTGGLAAHSSPPVLDTSELLNNEIMSRASMDVAFNVGTQATETISYVESLEATQTTSLPDGTIADQRTVGV